MARADKGMGSIKGHQHAETPKDRLTESDLASDEMGNNQLEGNDQEDTRNERRATPDVRQKTDGVLDSFHKLDKEARARLDLGKGNRSQGEQPYTRDDEEE